MINKFSESENVRELRQTNGLTGVSAGDAYASKDHKTCCLFTQKSLLVSDSVLVFLFVFQYLSNSTKITTKAETAMLSIFRRFVVT